MLTWDVHSCAGGPLDAALCAGDTCSAAACLGMLNFFLLGHQQVRPATNAAWAAPRPPGPVLRGMWGGQDFDVRWARGASPACQAHMCVAARLHDCGAWPAWQPAPACPLPCKAGRLAMSRACAAAAWCSVHGASRGPRWPQRLRWAELLALRRHHSGRHLPALDQADGGARRPLPLWHGPAGRRAGQHWMHHRRHCRLPGRRPPGAHCLSAFGQGGRIQPATTGQVLNGVGWEPCLRCKPGFFDDLC